MGSERDHLKKLLRTTDACLDFEAISRFVQADADERSLKQAKAHVESCPRCSAEVALYRDFLERRPSPSEAVDVEWIVQQLQERQPAGAARAQEPVNHFVRPSVRETGIGILRRLATTWRLQTLAAAAVVLLAAGVVLMYRTAPEFTVPGLRPGGELRSSGIEAISPSGDLELAPTQLAWKSVGGVVRYRVHVFEVDGNELWRGETRETSIPLPLEVVQRVVPGKKLLWRVSALDQDGRILQSSPEVAFRLKPPSAR